MRHDEWDKVEAAMDELLALYGERRRLLDLLRSSTILWRARQRRARMKALIMALVSFTAFASAGASALLQAATTARHPLLEWWPVIAAGAGILLAFGVARQRTTQAALDLAKKVDREIFDLKFAALEESLRMQFSAVHKAIDELRNEVQRNRPRRGDDAREVS